MKPQNLTHILIGIACFGLLPQIQAVSPTPDGCYPNFTTAEGCNALDLLTTGLGNTGLGWRALFSAGAANFNTAVGVAALALNTGNNNTAVGAAALLSNTTGIENSAVGTDALVSNTIGMQNTANGSIALQHNTTGSENTADGRAALSENDTGNGNTAIGFQALSSNSTGSDNIALGDGAGINLNMGSHNIYIGDFGVTTESSTIRIGTSNVQDAAFIAGISLTPVVGDAVVVDANGQLGTATSSARFKNDIKPMDKASESILTLKPVTFRYKSDSKGTPQFGLIAEEVAKVNPDLVVRDRKGEIYSVRYDAVNAMLLNEFLKEHKKVEEQQATITQLKKDFGATIAQLTGRLDKQASQIQKVCAQLEASKPAPQTVANNQ